VSLLRFSFELPKGEIGNAKNEGAKPRFIAQGAMEKRLAVPLKHGPKNENASRVARLSTEQEYYISGL
jgi:hypothetical protein